MDTWLGPCRGIRLAFLPDIPYLACPAVRHEIAAASDRNAVAFAVLTDAVDYEETGEDVAVGGGGQLAMGFAVGLQTSADHIEASQRLGDPTRAAETAVAAAVAVPKSAAAGVGSRIEVPEACLQAYSGWIAAAQDQAACSAAF